MTTLALVTSREHRQHDPDLPLLVAAAQDAGVRAEVVVWDDPDVPWKDHDLTVVRSCWDYVPRRDAFLAWARTVPRLHNPADVLAWTTDKTYLRILAERGVDVIETSWSVREGEPLAPAREWVVKPTVSAGSADTARWSTPEEVWRHSEQLLAAGRPTMVQPYVASVDTEGETALLFFDGELSHAIRKGPMLSREAAARVDPEMVETITARTPTPEQVAFGRSVLAVAADVLGDVPLYARVDVATLDDGRPALMELELAEPSLFLDHADGAAGRLVEAALRRIAG